MKRSTVALSTLFICRDSKHGASERKKSLPLSHKDRLLSRLSRGNEGRGATPERVEFEASVVEDNAAEDEDNLQSANSLMLDEDEWTDRNFGSSSLVLEENGKMEKRRSKEARDKNEAADHPSSDGHGDTSEDAISDLDTDTESDSEEEEEDEPGSRPLTSNEARQLQKEWIKRYDCTCICQFNRTS